MLVREGFSWGALIFGPLWLAVHRAWIAAVLTLAATILIVFLTRDAVAAALLATLLVLLGLSGQDLRRWSLDHRGYLLAQVIVARDELEALGPAAGAAARPEGHVPAARGRAMKVAVVDYGSGNLTSASRALALAAERAGSTPKCA